MQFFTSAEKKLLDHLFDYYINSLTKIIKENFQNEYFDKDLSYESYDNESFAVDFIRESTPFASYVPHSPAFYKGITWGLLNTKFGKETKERFKQGNISMLTVRIYLINTIKNLKEKFIKKFNSYRDFDEFSSLVYVIFLTISEFLLNYELYDKLIKEYSTESVSSKKKAQNSEYKREIRRLTNSFIFKFLTCFKVHKTSINLIDFDPCPTSTISPDIVNEIINDCELTLQLVNNPILLKSNPSSSNISYLLEFNLDLSLFNYSWFIKSVERSKNMNYFETMIFTTSIMDSKFYRNHYIHSIFVSAQLLKFYNSLEIKSIRNDTSLDLLIFAGLIHDECYPIEKIKYLVDSSTSTLKRMYDITFDFKDLLEFLLVKSNLNPLIEKYEFNFVKEMLSHDNETKLRLFNMQSIENFVFSKKSDHGYLSALFLFIRFFNMHGGVFSEFQSKFKLWKLKSLEEFKHFFYEEMLPLIYSILFHNLKNIQKNQFKFSRDLPFYSLLFFADIMQEWQRICTDFFRVILANFKVEKEIEYHIIYIIDDKRVPLSEDPLNYLEKKLTKTNNYFKRQLERFDFSTLNNYVLQIKITFQYIEKKQKISNQISIKNGNIEINKVKGE